MKNPAILTIDTEKVTLDGEIIGEIKMFPSHSEEEDVWKFEPVKREYNTYYSSPFSELVARVVRHIYDLKDPLQELHITVS